MWLTGTPRNVLVLFCGHFIEAAVYGGFAYGVIAWLAADPP
jgi:hypothetical protein